MERYPPLSRAVNDHDRPWCGCVRGHPLSPKTLASGTAILGSRIQYLACTPYTPYTDCQKPNLLSTVGQTRSRTAATWHMAVQFRLSVCGFVAPRGHLLSFRYLRPKRNDSRGFHRALRVNSHLFILDNGRSISIIACR